MTTYPALSCKNCGRPILLPSATHPGIPPNQAWWPMDGLPQTILVGNMKTENLNKQLSGDEVTYITMSRSRSFGYAVPDIRSEPPQCD
jgi:hypothetical protein